MEFDPVGDNLENESEPPPAKTAARGKKAAGPARKAPTKKVPIKRSKKAVSNTSNAKH